MSTSLSLTQLRRIIASSWEELTAWFVTKPRVFSMPHPEQQILFEFACRMRDSIRSVSARPTWDRLYFDGLAAVHDGFNPESVGLRPPLYLDTRQLFGVESSVARTPTAPDAAIALHVLRAPPEHLAFDDDGRPRTQVWLPTSVRAQGWLVEEQVRLFELLSEDACDCHLFVLYSNTSGRTTAVDSRESVSWATWTQPTPELWWTSRHFRAKAR